MFKYLLLGFVLMISGLEVAAQDGVTFVCEGVYHVESDTPQDFVLSDGQQNTTPQANGDYHFDAANAGVMVHYGGTYWFVPAQSQTPCAAADTAAADQFEHAMLTAVHEAGRRNIWGNVFRGE